MSVDNQTDLERLAEFRGIQTSYLDNTGQLRRASDQTLRTILQLLGLPVSSAREADDALREARAGRAGEVMEPVTVVWLGGPSPLFRVNIPGGESFNTSIIGENGERKRLKPLGKPRLVRGAHQTRVFFRLPSLQPGYYFAELEMGGELHKGMIIAAPRKLYSPDPPLHTWGLFAPLYSVRSNQSWGSGTFSDWRRFIEWTAKQGGRVAGSLPILSAFLGYPTVEPSPYSPASRLFWNEFFVDPLQLPEFERSASAQGLAGSRGFQKKINELRASEFVDYHQEMGLRRKILEHLAVQPLSGERAKAFKAYKRARPEVEEYARFRAACEKHKRSWMAWPERARSGHLSPADAPKAISNYYLYSQWAAQQQIDQCLATADKHDVRFYLDLPLGVNPDSYDAWKHRGFFAGGVSVGAPPDSFFTKGQNWGFAPLDPRRTRELHYGYVIQYLRFQMRHTGMLRIDHVMGLHRLFWIPHGLPARAGAYVRYPADELYAILSVESHRHKCMLVGENLGTVPPEANRAMDRHGLRRMYVLQYEQPAKGPVPAPCRSVVASLNTHDMPTFAAHWEGEDIADRVSLGLIPKKDIKAQIAAREQLRRNLLRFLRQQKILTSRDPSTEQVYAALLKFLATSRAETVLVNLEDLWGEKRPQNTPGTTTERANWSRKAKYTLEQLGTFEHLLRPLAAVRSPKRKR